MAVGVHVPLRFLRAAIKKGMQALKSRVPATQQTNVLEPIYSRIPRSNSILHPVLRQKIGGRWYSTTAKNALRFTNAVSPNVARAPTIRTVVGRLSTSSPIGSTLRPTLTGGAFPRTAGGYSIGGGARFFSHSPAVPAQVMQQVSIAMRAFLHRGKGQMDSYQSNNCGVGRTSVWPQLAASLAQHNAPGAYVDFDLSPTITSISPFNTTYSSIEDSSFLAGLSADFGGMIGDIIAINADIKRLSALGDLPISLVGKDLLRVHFRGCDGDFVERLCEEVGVRRGMVHEDESFTFGIAPPDVGWKEMLGDSTSQLLSSTYSEDGFEDDVEYNESANICSRISGSESVGGSQYFEPADCPIMVDSLGHSATSSNQDSGLEVIHRFLELCDEHRSGLSFVK